MTRKRAETKTFITNRALVLSSQLERYCRGLEDWPRSWMGWGKDLPPGEKLVEYFRPFLQNLICSDLSPKTIQKHVDNLWVLGGEIIRDLNEDPSLRKVPMDRLLHDAIATGSGPLIHNGSDDEQRSFDSTCRRFRRFLTHTGRARPQRGEKGKRQPPGLDPKPWP